MAAPTSARAGARRTRMNSAERRAAIIDAARPIFAEHGYHATSTADIAAAAHCSEALLYRHFASKHALLLAVLEEGAAIAQERLYDTIADADDPFATLCAKWAELSDDEEYRSVLRVRAQAATLTQEPDLRELLAGIRETFRGIIRGALATSQERGHIRPEVDIDDLGRLYGGLTFAAAFATAVEGSEEAARLGHAAETLAAVVRPL